MLSKALSDNTALNERISALESRPDVKEYNDTKLLELINSIEVPEPYDDNEVIKMIQSIDIPESYV